MDQIKERCIYCGSDVYYTGTEVLIKCGMCGHTLVVAKFENELARMNQAIEEGEQAKKDLAEAEAARQDAQVRLMETIDTLGRIKDDQGVLSTLMQSVMAGQVSSEDKLAKLKDISARILNGQGDLIEGMAVFGEIKDQLEMIGLDQQAQKEYARDFINWFQNIHEDDVSRLKDLGARAADLLAGQKAINDKIDFLRSSADAIRENLDEFHSRWKESQLEELRQLYHQAENHQYDRMYDKAYDKYEQIVAKGGGDAEVIWRLILCHYCVSYQADDQGNFIPIILNPDLTAPDEMSVRREFAIRLDKEPESVQTVYRAELTKIDRILDQYRMLSSKHEYDVFISVKQDHDGHYTSDSDVASDLYDFLKQQGLRVFNSRRTAIPAGQEYEPYIIAALISAKVLIVVGTTPENMNSDWVKNEWSRFQWLQRREKEKTGKTDRVLFCYLAKGMRAEDIPRALHPDRQAVYDGVKAQSELLAGISSLKGIKASTNRGVAGQQEAQDFRKIEDQMTFWLIQGRYDRVLNKYNELTEAGFFLTQVQLHLLALCAEKQVVDVEQVVCSEVILEQEAEFKAAIMLCRSEAEKEKLRKLLEKNQEWRSGTRAGEEVKEAETQQKADEDQTSESDDIEEWFRRGEDAEEKDDLEEALVWFRKAAEAGAPDAMNRVGEYYKYGWGVPEDKKEAVKWYKMAAELGNVSGYILYGDCLAEGAGIRKNKAAAFKWYKKAVEADENGPNCLRIGKCYENGIGIKVNKKEAAKWYKKAVDQDFEPAKEYFEKLSSYYTENEDGQTASEDLVTPDQCLAAGREAEEKGDYEEALKQYKAAAEANHTEAQYVLAKFYLYGNVPSGEYDNEEIAEMIEYLEHPMPGLYRFNSELDLKALQEEENAKKALLWCRKAAETGHDGAQYLLGAAYSSFYVPGLPRWFTAIGVKQRTIPDNDKEAWKWFEKAAQAGNKDAQFMLGQCFEKGRLGVGKSKERAKEWYQKASRQGHSEAEKMLKRWFW